MMQRVSFPGLGFSVSLSRVAFTIFGWPIYWYGILIGCGVLCGLWLAVRNAKRIGFSTDLLYDFVLWVLPLSVIGARIYYVVYRWEDYRSNLSSVFAVWEGGLAIYGGVLTAIFVAVCFCRFRHIALYDLLDTCSISLLLGQAIGRWGNFVNQEAYGTFTDLPWRMELPGIGAVHPTFLYESLWNFVGVVVLQWVFCRHRRFRGLVFWLYLLWYGAGRFWIEGLRTDSLMLGPFRVSMVVAGLSVLCAGTMLLYQIRQQKQKP